MIKNIKTIIIVLSAIACLAAGFLAAKLITDKGQDDVRGIQERLKDSITFPAEERKVLEKITLEADLSERGNVYQGSETELYDMYSSAGYKDPSPIKLMELLPWSEVNGLNRSYGEPSEYIALYLYGDKDEYGHMDYALQWGDVVVKVDELMLESRSIKMVKNRAYTADGEWLEMLVMHDYEAGPYVFVKQGDNIVQYKVRGCLYNDMLEELYQLEVSGSDLMVYTHNAVLRVRGEEENEWDGMTFGCTNNWSSEWTIRISIEAGESYTIHDSVALLTGDIYLDVDKGEFTFKHFNYFASQELEHIHR